MLHEDIHACAAVCRQAGRWPRWLLYAVAYLGVALGYESGRRAR